MNITFRAGMGMCGLWAYPTLCHFYMPIHIFPDNLPNLSFVSVCHVETFAASVLSYQLSIFLICRTTSEAINLKACY